MYSINYLLPSPDTTNVSMTSELAMKLEKEAEAAAVKAATAAALPPEVSSLQSEENVSISGSNARLMIMKKLSRKTEVRNDSNPQLLD